MIKRTHLRHFVAIVESGGFTAAATRLNLTQPTLSASMVELERSVGSPLIVRDRKRIRVTDAGYRLLELARSIERDFRLAETAISAKSHPHRPLRVGMLSSLPSAWLVGIRRNYSGVRPMVLVEGGDADLRRRLNSGQLDAAITILRSRDEAVGPTLEEDYVVLLAESHELSNRPVLRAEDLSNETMIARRSCEILSETSDFFTARGIRPHFLMRSANEDRCLDLVRSGYAITTGPLCLAGNGIVGRALDEYNFHRTLGMITRQGEKETDLIWSWNAIAQPA